MKVNLPFHRMPHIWLFLSIISLALTMYLSLRYSKIYHTLIEQAKKQARQETKEASRKLETFITGLIPIAESIATTISTHPEMHKEELEKLLQEKKPISVTGLGVAFLPYTFDPQTRLYAPYYFECNGELKFRPIEYDYTLPQYTWFHKPLKKGPRFIEPFYGEASETILAEYDTPIYRENKQGNKEPIGVIFANQSIEHLKHILNTLFLGQKGYWTIITKKGYFLAHPRDQLVHQRITIFDLAEKLRNPMLAVK